MDEANATDWFSKPGDSIRAVMQRRLLSADHVATRLEGGLGTLRSLLDGSMPIDTAMARSLADALGASPAFWLKRQENFERAVDRAVSAISPDEVDEFIRNVPAPGARARGKMSDARRAEEVRKRLVYFSVPNTKSWQEHYGRLVGRTEFRSSSAFATKEEAVLLWLRRGELESDLIKTKEWSAGNLQDRVETIKQLSRLKSPDHFLPKLRVLLAEAGVALAVVKAPTGCRASGATRLVTPDKAMILMSFRHRSDDHFWFTLLHEIGHLILHHAQTFVDTDEDVTSDVREDEANEYARRCIVPEDKQDEFESLTEDRDRVLRFSVKLKVAAGLTVGQMQKRALIGHDKLNGLKRRWSWEEINPIEV
ncbi:ImmA/IrrE family metallo-endopeptidase [Rhizobium leguminosarum bv. viciae]|uniref:ImmA/IrrE family metallo-endopeptidase n=1 Tax=Rhizobium leguminosarum bv. viciae TaxID=387 RepID=A0A8I2KH23_RHILV|nr:ImmA/IrrE family metallo-endopeptidase [Rhizobium leguminosarum]NKM44310.1 ImmA/IrrE family metallo-endopeptidase [Rhizobium leguminosarum bv. viciae]